MEPWLKISVLLSVFGFIKEIRPSEPFISNYILGEWRNITEEQLSQDVYPVGTYSYLAQLVLVFLITDFFRYKPLIVVCGISGIIVWSMLLWTTSLVDLQVLEFFYGTYMSTEVAYYTFIYAKVDKEHYQKVTSHTRAATLVGRFIAGSSAQILVYTKLMDYRDLNYISIVAQILATIWALFLPSVSKSLYFHRDATHQKSNKYARAFKILWHHFLSAYTNWHVIQWSLWYSLAMCGFIQVQSYIQILWALIEPDAENSGLWNGAIEAALTLLGAGAALLAGYLKSYKGGLLTLTICSFLEGGAILTSAQTDSLWLSYAGYIIFGALYMFMITIASAEIAKYLDEDSFGLIFGINTMYALAFQTILTVVVISKDGFELQTRDQFIVYGYYFIALGALYFVATIVIYFIRPKNKAQIS
ncbi:thiamine transporter 1-like [Ctenocephalides felis]|uniref:thiamine transporter 1-like n=1 Tax=Ctenocephalides felis TaxID=7515 RepID=UPI000E6E3F45|nr:thiamine transporter 1-like [Ctenocephalides felis]